MNLCGRTMHGSGSCNTILESLTFAVWGKIVPSLPDLDCRVTQGMFEVFVVWRFVSSLRQILIFKKRKTMNTFAKQCLWAFLINIITLLKQLQKCLKWSLI